MHYIERSTSELLGSLNDLEGAHSPARLFLQGDLSLLAQGARVAVVGSRKATAAGIARAERFARELAQRGVVIVSGLAAGIDTAAHRAAMACGGRTMAVLGTPLDEVYPRENAALQAAIARDHLLVSQFVSGSPVTRKNFPIRNRTMALLCDATVIVEATQTSGTRHQGWEALRLGRVVFLAREVVADQSLTWPAEMMRYGAQVLSDENLEAVAENLPALGCAVSLARAA
ncbi:MAG: DNA-protecting protein DprA [Burkholderiales bacterium]|nr:DNA-protecting protein DprA [Burkholderiales bacterium]